MKVTLGNHEIIEAVREWCARRGIVVDKGNKMTLCRVGYIEAITDAELTIAGVELPVQDGPYR